MMKHSHIYIESPYNQWKLYWKRWIWELKVEVGGLTKEIFSAILLYQVMIVSTVDLGFFC